MSLSPRAIARFRPRRARECRFYRTVNITVTNTGSGEGHPPAACSSAHARIGIMHRRERGASLMRRVQNGSNPMRMPLFSLSSFSIDSRIRIQEPTRVSCKHRRIIERTFVSPIALPINNFPITDIMSPVYCARSFIAS